MDSNFQPPPIPGTSGAALGGNYAATTNPYFTVANQFLPRNMHDVIRWSRYITMQSPVTTEVIRKLSTYPITDFAIETESEQTRSKYKEVFKSFGLKHALHDIGFEYYTVGNVFVSVYFPIHRSLVCKGCGTAHSAKKADFTTFKKYEFFGTCPACNHTDNFIRRDTKSQNIADMNLIKWDPTNIAVNHNPITGESEFYYKIPNDIKKRVQMGDKLFVNSVPWGIIEAIKNNQDFRFDENNIYHLKNISAGHQINGIAVPPLISLFSLVYYQATLRKANESISTDFMNPMRVVYPAPQTANSDPVVSISMRNFVSNMTEAFVRHKKDRNHVLVAPVPIGYQAISGEGKNLLVSQEIQQAEESILLSLGVSRELLSGVTNWSSSTVGLRLLQNTMNTYTGQIDGLINWVMGRVSRYLGIEACEVHLTPFKLTDDDSLRQMLLQTYMQGEQTGNGPAASTVYEAFGMDYAEDLKRKQKDAILKANSDVNIKFAVEQATFIAAKEVTDRFDKNSDYRTMLSKAHEYVQQIMQMGDETAKLQILGQLRVEEYPLYLVIMSLLKEYTEQAQAQAEEQEATGATAEEGGGGAKPTSGKDSSEKQKEPAKKNPNTEGKKKD